MVEIPWIALFTAFTAPGRYVYIMRRLLERCPDEETTAFVIAHEIAHHDLGHLDIFRGPFARHAARLQAGQLVVLFFRHLQKRIYSPAWECDADARAIELCVAAGYDPASARGSSTSSRCTPWTWATSMASTASTRCRRTSGESVCRCLASFPGRARPWSP